MIENTNIFTYDIVANPGFGMVTMSFTMDIWDKSYLRKRFIESIFPQSL
jgi:hypothetical protein